MRCGMNELDHRILSLLKPWSTAPRWPDSSADGALHQHRRDQGSNPRLGLNFQDFLAATLAAARCPRSSVASRPTFQLRALSFDKPASRREVYLFYNPNK